MLVRQVLEGCNEFFVDVDAELAMSAWGERERLDVASHIAESFFHHPGRSESKASMLAVFDLDVEFPSAILRPPTRWVSSDDMALWCNWSMGLW